jgi:uncharacterized membrane protein YkvA (DUF1232 family)
MSEEFWQSLTRELPSEARSLFARLRVSDDLRPPKVLAGEVKAYVGLVRATGRDSEVVAVEKAEKLGQALLHLLRSLRPDGPVEHHQAVQAACLYFAAEYDGDEDMESLEGFDDDIEVMNAVARAMDLDEYVIDLW